jgi:hypothetical protein
LAVYVKTKFKKVVRWGVHLALRHAFMQVLRHNQAAPSSLWPQFRISAYPGIAFHASEIPRKNHVARVLSIEYQHPCIALRIQSLLAFD